METTKHKLKINNSYESEPSSGSGSAASDNNDYATLEDDELDLPQLLLPQPQKQQLHEHNISIAPPPKISSLAAENSDIYLNLSSVESLFEGFPESPFVKLKHKLLDSPANTINKNQLIVNPALQSTPPKAAKKIYPSPGKLVFPKFYDTLIEDNSCNAIYLPLSSDVEKNQQNIVDTKLTKTTSDIDALLTTTTTTTTTEMDLSFNGKIKSLIKNENTTDVIKCNKNLKDSQNEHSISKQLNLNETTDTTNNLTRKYICMKSPDLFEDDDEDDLANYTGIILDNSDIQPLAKVASDKIMTETTTATTTTTTVPNATNVTSKCSSVNSTDETTKLNCNKQNGEHSKAMLRENCLRDLELLRRIRKCLSGIPPPPSFTTVQVDLFDAVLRNKDEILNFFNKNNNETTTTTTAESTTKATKVDMEQKVNSLFKPTQSLELTKKLGWKDVLAVRQHGLSYNLSKATESSEYLSLSVVERYVASETGTSFRQSPTSAKKRNIRMKLLTQSPGSRLSHLAKRRTVFSSQSLATTGIKMNIGPQILIDKKKSKHKRKGLTPKRNTPGSRKKTRKTPTSSARKSLFRTECPSRETSKRALFQSPAKKFEKMFTATQKPLIKPEIADRVEKSKRALFSPEKDTNDTTTFLSTLNNNDKTIYKQPSLENLLNKRKRNLKNANVYDDDDDDDDDMNSMEFDYQRNKLFCGSSENLTPRALKIKSQSFCIGAGSSSTAVSSSTENLTKMINATATKTTTATTTTTTTTLLKNNTSQLFCDNNKSNFCAGGIGKMQRSYSEMAAPSGGLSESHRKKCLWAISIALQEKKITTKHENFRKFGCVLTRVVKRLFQEFYKKSSTSTSETMLRLAKKYVYYVISGRSVDEIYLKAKTDITQSQQRLTQQRLSGYIGPEEYEQRKQMELTFSESKSLLHSQLFSQSQASTTTTASNCSQNSLKKTTSMLSIFECESMDPCSLTYSELNSITQTPSSISCISQDILKSGKKSTQLPIQPNVKLQNSSSKNNLNGLALRENVDGEQRRSAQKNFNVNNKEQTGSRIASPFNAFNNNVDAGGSTVKQNNNEQKFLGSKAKRLICFDM